MSSAPDDRWAMRCMLPSVRKGRAFAKAQRREEGRRRPYAESAAPVERWMPVPRPFGHSLRKGGGLVDAPGRGAVGTKGEYPFMGDPSRATSRCLLEATVCLRSWTGGPPELHLDVLADRRV